MYYFWDNWALYHKCIFDGENKLIFISPGETIISVKTDLYSDWKEWVQVDQNSKFEPALRTIGGDPLGETQYAGDMYFLINDWQIVIDHYTEINGILYSDNFPSPYIIRPGGGVFATVSSLALAYNTTGVTVPSVEDIRVEMDNNSTKLTSIDAKVQTLTVSPTASEIADEVRIELTPEMAHIMTLENNPGLTSNQATMLLELYTIMGLDPTKPLTVSNTTRTAGDIDQIIDTNTTRTIMTRQ